MLKQADKALEHCNVVIELDPGYWRAYNNRALVYLEMERYEESEADIAQRHTRIATTLEHGIESPGTSGGND